MRPDFRQISRLMRSGREEQAQSLRWHAGRARRVREIQTLMAAIIEHGSDDAKSLLPLFRAEYVDWVRRGARWTQ